MANLRRNALHISLLLTLCATRASTAPLAWIGGVTPNSFELRLDVDNDVTEVLLAATRSFDNVVSTQDPSDPAAFLSPRDVYDSLRRFSFTGLQPQTKYYIGTRVGNAITRRASVTTFPEAGAGSDVVIALSSCQFRAGWDDAWEDIREWQREVESRQTDATFLMLHMGDLHYANIKDNDIARFEDSAREVLTRRRAHAVFNSAPVAYMYDDHDYGDNNANFFSPSRQAALENFREMVPNYPLVSAEASYYAFTVGSVRIIMTDLRAQSSREIGSMMGSEQREWFFEELENASDFEVVIWMTSKPWIGSEEAGDDSWRGFPGERRIIANRIAELGITNLIAVAGDAHMLAADNGVHSDYSDGVTPPAGFPVFQAAPLGNVGSTKGGGPYSEGCVAYRFFRNKQYGVINITEIGEPGGPCVAFSGYKAGSRDDAVVSFRRCGRLGGVDGTGRQESTCSIPFFPAWVWVVIAIAIVVVIVVISFCVWFCIVRRRRNRKAQREVTEVLPSSNLVRSSSKTDQDISHKPSNSKKASKSSAAEDKDEGSKSPRKKTKKSMRHH